MADQSVTIRRECVGRRSGRLDEKDSGRIHVAIALELGLAE
jgi:hypothetical protein